MMSKELLIEIGKAVAAMTEQQELIMECLKKVLKEAEDARLRRDRELRGGYR